MIHFFCMAALTLTAPAGRFRKPPPVPTLSGRLGDA